MLFLVLQEIDSFITISIRRNWTNWDLLMRLLSWEFREEKFLSKEISASWLESNQNSQYRVPQYNFNIYLILMPQYWKLKINFVNWQALIHKFIDYIKQIGWENLRVVWLDKNYLFLILNSGNNKRLVFEILSLLYVQS